MSVCPSVRPGKLPILGVQNIAKYNGVLHEILTLFFGSEAVRNDGIEKAFPNLINILSHILNVDPNIIKLVEYHGVVHHKMWKRGSGDKES